MSQRRTGVLTYILASFGIAWVLWYGLVGQGWEPGSTDIRWAVLQGAFAPALAAIGVRLWIDKGFGDAGLGLKLRKAWKHYLVALLWPLPCAAVVLLAAQVLGLAQVDWTFHSGLAAMPMPESGPPASYAGGAVSIISFSLTMALFATPILFGEEFGWRGYLQQRIFHGKPMAAVLATGCLWSLWHLPLNLRGYNFPDHPLLGVLVFTVSCVLLSVIFGWLLAASGSIWCVSLAHASTNAVGASLVLLATDGRPDIAVSFLGLLGWLPLGLLAAWVVATGRLRPAPLEPPPAPGHETERDVL